jgi:hypothetical protein
MTVEDALELDEQKISPEGYYNRLMAQATPSWNLDRTRLADGGSGLQRLEVLGVPAEAATRFQQYARMLVSTGDPSRLMAFVAHVGAAHVAIQQWDSYLASYERVRGCVPLHILPQFQADSEGARQAFALGSLFGFIKNQGSYFYYVPADNLSKPVKLAQGLSNTLQAFINRDALVREAWERIEQVVAAQGVETVLRRLTAYYDDQDTRYPADDLILELKQLVRRYADELRQVYQFTGSVLMSEPEPTIYSTREVRHVA